MDKKLRWAVNMYESWRDQRNRVPDYCPITASLSDMSTVNKTNLSYGMVHFLSEVLKVNSEEFPAKTLYEITVCIQMYMESQGVHYKLLDDPDFKNMKFTLDNLMKEATSSGIGMHVRKAEVLSFEDEEKLWSSGALGSSTPDQLLNTVVFLLGLHCCLRAGKEHHALRAPGYNSQLRFVYHDGIRHLEYCEDVGLKTNKGRLKHRKLKLVTIFPFKNKSRCPVELFRLYASKLPTKCKHDSLYCHPKKNYTVQEWYSDMPVGINTLSKVVKRLCDKAGIKGHFTNHSLCSSAVTRMYQARVEEQVISEFSGHRSLAIWEYKHTNIEQKRIASSVLSHALCD